MSLDDLRADRTSNGGGPPDFVTYGGFKSAAAGSTEVLQWVVVDGDADWAVDCMQDPDPEEPMRWPSMKLWGGTAMQLIAIISST